MTRLLIAIANHGSANRAYLDRLLAEYRSMPIKKDIVVLSDRPKDLGSDIEVRVGAPTTNPWSLPFAHRRLFRERLDDYDYFLYSEDDTLLSWSVLERFIQSQTELAKSEIAGFIRTEVGPDGRVFYSTSHSFFRWRPDTTRERNGGLWAAHSNEHAALFVASRSQLHAAFASGGFGDEPHEGRHDMLCAAATDIYTGCGLERLLCIDDLDKFTLPHLPNKYIGRMGLPREEMLWQLEALRLVQRRELTADSLFSPETNLPRSLGSKFCREAPDSVITEALGPHRSRVLVWGGGDGIAEAELAASGHDVSVCPIDSVLGYCCQRRGLKVIPCADSSAILPGAAYDSVVMRDCLHLLPDPSPLLEQLRLALRTGGRIVVRIPNLNDVRILKRRLLDPHFRERWRRVSPEILRVSQQQLYDSLSSAGFRGVQIRVSIPAERERLARRALGTLNRYLSPSLYAVAQK